MASTAHFGSFTSGRTYRSPCYSLRASVVNCLARVNTPGNGWGGMGRDLPVHAHTSSVDMRRVECISKHRIQVHQQVSFTLYFSAPGARRKEPRKEGRPVLVHVSLGGAFGGVYHFLSLSPLSLGSSTAGTSERSAFGHDLLIICPYPLTS